MIDFYPPNDQTAAPAHEVELRPRITVIGVGGAGGNAVNNMIRSNLEGVEFVVANTDNQALAQSLAERRLQLGVDVTRGLGAGSRPEVGRAAAEEALEALVAELGESNMAFITAGMGGGTGTGAAPVIAQGARERGILTVGVVTKPFHFEGAHRMRIAEEGIEELTEYVDTLIVIPNQNLFRVANEKTTFADAFQMADNVLHQGVRGVTDLMVMPGLINLDFADIRTVMSEMGKAMMGTGEAAGDKRAVEAAEAAISNPLLDDTSMRGARGVLINLTGGPDMGLFEVDEATNRIREEVDPEANIIFGSTFDEKLQGAMRVSVVATGIAAEGVAAKPKPQMTLVSSQARPAAENRPAAASAAIAAPAAPPPMAGTVPRAPAPPPAAYAAPMPRTVASVGAPAVAMAAAAAAAPAPAPARMEAQPDRLSAVEATVREIAAAAPAATAAAPARAAAPAPFVAPPPAAPARRPAAPPQPRTADPFNAAAVANATQEGPRSLFQRVTGMGRRPPEAPAQAAAPNPAAAPAPAAPRTEARPLDRPERGAVARPEDDLLDIPAFLRRQAN